MTGLDLDLPEDGTSYLRETFRAFAAELLALKEKVERGEAASVDAGADPETAPGVDIAARIRSTLEGMLKRWEFEAARLGGVPRFDEARYVMAALADEVFLHQVVWPGRTAWRNDLLETRLFGTQAAGQRIFERIDELVQRPDIAARDLAVVYLIALCLDFRGRYRRRDDVRAREAYRAKLYRYVMDVAGLPLEADRPVCVQAYAHTLDHGQSRKLPGIGRWVAAVAVVVGLFLIGGQMMWTMRTAPLRCLTTPGVWVVEPCLEMRPLDALLIEAPPGAYGDKPVKN